MERTGGFLQHNRQFIPQARRFERASGLDDFLFNRIYKNMANDGLTKNEIAIIEFLKTQQHQFYPPTWIARKMFPDTNRHSAWASPICKRLVKKGYLRRNEHGHYKLVHR